MFQQSAIDRRYASVCFAFWIASSSNRPNFEVEEEPGGGQNQGMEEREINTSRDVWAMLHPGNAGIMSRSQGTALRR